MVTLPSHTFHALQPLDVSCFKPFKITFEKEKDNTMVKNNHYELEKCTLVTWVTKALDQSLSKKNIKSGFRGIGIWPLNVKAMDDKVKLIQMYTTIKNSNENNESFDGSTIDI
jgi:hypothetical protein